LRRWQRRQQQQGMFITPGLGPSQVSHRRFIIIIVIIIPLIIFNRILFIDTFIFVLFYAVKHGAEQPSEASGAVNATFAAGGR